MLKTMSIVWRQKAIVLTVRCKEIAFQDSDISNFSLRGGGGGLAPPSPRPPPWPCHCVDVAAGVLLGGVGVFQDAFFFSFFKTGGGR